MLWAIKERLFRASIRYNQQDVQDILQKVFVLLWEKGKLKQIRDRNKISSWLVMVAANCALNHFRCQKEIPCQKEDLFANTQSTDYMGRKNFDRENLYSIFENMLNNLPAKEQIIVKLNYLYGKKQREIAEILKIPQNSVSSIVKRTKDKLQQELKDFGWEKF
ncbi:MAG: sigma-70 family RNA polymerase sigma factor [Candidatus Omnitrophica bacterium]|nr:sigma-70 family RNA polymerase sigma factor [Candidatus Omnitrophota bacterium]